MIEGDSSVQKLKDRFPNSALQTSEFREERTVVIRAADIVPICQFLRDDPLNGSFYDSVWRSVINLIGF